MTIILGIDPGANTGVAVYRNGKLEWLMTWNPWEIPAELALHGADRVVYEDSRLTSPVWSRGTSAAARIKIARNVGQVDAWCSLIVAVCGELEIPAHGISPKNKGAKLDAAHFARVTGWAGHCNQHERDAAMVAWPYRSAK
jgi:hypothetical protein